jgi:hypothetical protein
MCKVQWSHHIDEEGTWEREEVLKQNFHVSFLIRPNLEDEIHFKRGRFVTPCFSQKNKTSKNISLINKCVCCIHATTNFIVWWGALVFYFAYRNCFKFKIDLNSNEFQFIKIFKNKKRVLLCSLRLWAETQLSAKPGLLFFSPHASLPRPKPRPSSPSQGPLSSDESSAALLLMAPTTAACHTNPESASHLCYTKMNPMREPCWCWTPPRCGILGIQTNFLILSWIQLRILDG